MKKTICKPWTPDNCPLKPGDVTHDIHYNNDVLVLKRFLDWDEKDDNINKNKPLISVCLAGMIITLTGKELMDNRWEWYPNWPDTGTIKPCYEISEAGGWVSDYFKWERQLPLADLPDTGKAIRDFKDAIVNQQKVSLVLQLGLTLKDTIRKDWEEPETEWFDDIDSAVLRYAKENEDVEN